MEANEKAGKQQQEVKYLRRLLNEERAYGRPSTSAEPDDDDDDISAARAAETSRAGIPRRPARFRVPARAHAFDDAPHDAPHAREPRPSSQADGGVDLALRSTLAELSAERERRRALEEELHLARRTRAPPPRASRAYAAAQPAAELPRRAAAADAFTAAGVPYVSSTRTWEMPPPPPPPDPHSARLLRLVQERDAEILELRLKVAAARLSTPRDGAEHDAQPSAHAPATRTASAAPEPGTRGEGANGLPRAAREQMRVETATSPREPRPVDELRVMSRPHLVADVRSHSAAEMRSLCMELQRQLEYVLDVLEHQTIAFEQLRTRELAGRLHALHEGALTDEERYYYD